MKKNKSQSKSSDNIRKSRCEGLANQNKGNAKKGRKVQRKTQKKTTSREILKTVLPGIRYSNGQSIKKEIIEMMNVSVMKSALEDLEGIGNERLVLWKMSAEETEELKQQVKQEALHKKRENIMPLVLQMSVDQIETAYEGIVKLWNIPDNLPIEECDDENTSDDNASDVETKGEEESSRSVEVFGLDSCVPLAYDNSGCDIMPSADCSKTDDKSCGMRSSTEDLKIRNDGKSPIAEMEFCCDSVDVIVQQFASTETAGVEPSNVGNIEIVLPSFEESPVIVQPKPDQFSGEAFVAPLLIEYSLVSKPNKLGDEVSRKLQDINGEEAKSKESVSVSISDKCQPDDSNQSKLCSSITGNILTSDFTSIRTIISAAEICVSDSAAANDTCNSDMPEMSIGAKLIKRKRSIKAKYAKKMKFYVDDLPCLVSDSMKTQSQDVNLTTDSASDKNTAITQTNMCTSIDSTLDQIAQAVASDKEPRLECTASIKECSTCTSISTNCSCDVKKSRNKKTETQKKDLSVDHKSSQNESYDQLKPCEVHENVVIFSQPTLYSKSVSNLSKTDVGTEKVKNVSKHKTTNGKYQRKDHKQRNSDHAASEHVDSAKVCDQKFELVRRSHLNLALDKKTISGKVSDETSFKSVTKSRMRHQVAKKDMCSTDAVLGSKESFSKCLKEEYVSEMKASQVKHKANTRVLPVKSERERKAVIPLNSELKHADKLSNHVSEEGKVNKNSSVRNLITANHANRHHVKAVRNNGKRKIANNSKLCQSKVRENNTRIMKTIQKSGPSDIEVDVSCRSSTTMCNLGQTGGNNKTKNGNQDPDLHQTEQFISIDKGKAAAKNMKPCQSEIIENCSRNFTSNHLDHCYAEIIQSIDDRKRGVSDSGPSETEIIDSSCKAKDLGLLQIEATGVDRGSREETFRDLSRNHKSSKSSSVLCTISSKSKHEKAPKRTSNKLQSKSSHQKDWDQDTQHEETLSGISSFSAQNELDAEYSSHIILDINKTELDYTNHASNDLGKNQNDKIQDSETKNDTERDKLKGLTMVSMKLETSKQDSQKEENCCNTAVAQIEATILSLNTSSVTEKLVVHAADDPSSRSSNHDKIQHDAVSLNNCSSAVEEQMKGDLTVSVHDGHKQEHIICRPENSFCRPVSELIVPRNIDLKEVHWNLQLITVNDSIVNRNERLLSRAKDDSSEVKHDSCTSSDVLKNDCLVTRSGNFCLLDCNSSNSELPDSGHLPVLSVEAINSINNNYCHKTISPIHSPSPHSSSSLSFKKDRRRYVNGRPLQVMEPVAIPLIVEDTKVRNLLEYMCQAEILRLLRDV